MSTPQRPGALRRRTVLALPLAGLGAVTPALANGKWPDKPIRIIVPWPAGGIADSLARHVGRIVSADVGVPVIVENKPGAGSNIGSAFVAKAPADGYTLLLATSTNAANVTFFKNLPYDPVRDLAAVSLLTIASTALVVNPKEPFRNLRELIAYAKKNPDELAYASPGVGSPGHLAAERLKLMAGIRMRHVAYQGAPQAVQDVIGGAVRLAFVNVNVTQSFIENGRLRALGVTTSSRWPLLPGSF